MLLNEERKLKALDCHKRIISKKIEVRPDQKILDDIDKDIKKHCDFSLTCRKKIYALEGKKIFVFLALTIALFILSIILKTDNPTIHNIVPIILGVTYISVVAGYIGTNFWICMKRYLR